MIQQVLDPASYAFSLYAIPNLAATAFLLLLALLLLIHERASRVSRRFAVVALTVSGWLFAFAWMYSTTNETVALWWAKAAYLAVPFIGPAIYHFTTVALEIYPRCERLVRLGWSLGALFSVVILTTDTLIAGLYPYWWGYYPKYGWLSVPFLTFFFSMMIASLHHYWTEYRISPPGIRKSRIRLFMIAFFFAYVATIDYVPKFGIPIYPIGYLSVLAWLGLVANAIWRHQFMDITPAFAAEQVTNTVTDALLVLDREGIVRVANRAACRLLGFSEGSLVGESITVIQNFFPREKIESVLETGSLRNYKVSYPVPDNGVLMLEISASVIRDRAGYPVAVVCLARDITERRQAEEAIKASEERFRSVAQSANDAIVSADSRGDIISWNRGAQTMFGYREEEILGRPLTVLMPERYRAGHRKGLERMRTTGEAHVIGKTVELHGLRKDGTEFPLELSLATWKTGHENFYSGIIRDITERKRAEEALKESNEFNQQIIASAKQGIIVYDRELKYVLWNPFMEEMVGLSADQVLGKHCLELFPFLRDQGVYALLERALEGEYATAPNINYSIPLTGRTGWVSGQYGPFRNATGEIIGVIGILSDITEQKRGEEALRQSEEQFRLLVATVKDYAIIMLDPAGHVVSWNEGAERIKGYRADEIMGQHFSRFLPREDIEAGKPALALKIAVEQGTYEETGWRVRKDGTRFWANVVITAIRDQAETLRGFSKVTRDITERKHLEEQLRQSQKMEAIGSLAGGIAHDFNNLLMVITGYSQLLLDRLDQGDPLRGDIKEIKQAGERAAGLTQQLLTFSRRQMLTLEVLDLNAIVTGMGNMLRRLIGENIHLVLRPEQALGMVKADRGQIEQVIMNLVVNARDAMSRGGQLTIETANVEMNETQASRHGNLKAGAYVMLAVTDTGCGMDVDTQARIFEPFFTTKEQGKGTGLGLSTVYGIINQSKGSIEVESEPGKGSTFTIYLSRIKSEVKTEGSAVAAGVPRGSETILVVEDEDIVRGLLRKVLQANGYVVLEAASGRDALWLSQDHAGPIQLLITDVVMPGMNGRELAERLMPLRPDMKVIFISGYIDDAVVRKGVAEFQANFLQKPIEPSILMRKVREVLERA
jgi:two-component system cell cycle sensor histidine kinase/response regulator CckA